MSSDPGARSRQQLERARESVQKIHQAAVRHRDPGLHELADDISEVALTLGHDAGPVQEWRACPVCGAEPGSNCIRKPGHEMVNGMHPERTKL
ncbi:zinc finger domain-containing protein [Micromonospora chersina]